MIFPSILVANRSDHNTDQDLLSHLLKSLANQTSEHGGKGIAGLLQEPQNLLNDGASAGHSEVVTFLSNGPQGPPRPAKQHHAVSVSEIPQQEVHAPNANGGNTQATCSLKPKILNSPPAYSEVRDSASGQIKINNFDLNDIYIDSDDGIEDAERSPAPTNVGTSSLDCPSWVQQESHQSSPPQTSGNSDSASAQSPSSSSGEAQVYLGIAKYMLDYCIHLGILHMKNIPLPPFSPNLFVAEVSVLGIKCTKCLKIAGSFFSLLDIETNPVLLVH